VHLGDLYRDGWLKGRIGVVIFVDDESGAGMLAASEVINRRYPPLRRNMLLEEPLRLIGRETLRRDKIEKTALALVDVISRLQDDEQQAKHRDRMVALSLVGVLAAGVALLLFVRWKSGARPKGESVSKPADSDSL
jgi:hypothetical protein